MRKKCKKKKQNRNRDGGGEGGEGGEWDGEVPGWILEARWQRRRWFWFGFGVLQSRSGKTEDP